MDVGIISKKIISSRKKWMILNLFFSTILLLLIEGFDFDKSNFLFLLYALWQLCLFGWMLFSELRYPGLNILSVLFVGTLVGIALPSFTYSTSLLNGEKINYGEVNDVTDFLFHTAVAMNIYFSLFILLLTFFTKGRLFIVDINQIAKKFNLFYLSIGVYFIALVLRLIPFLELISSNLASLAGSLPMLVLFLLASYCGFSAKHDKYYKLFVIILVLEILYAMLFGYYKGTVVQAAAMYIVYYYLYSRTINKPIINGRIILIALVFLFFLLYIVYPFISLRRSESGFSAMADVTELNKVDNLDILRRVITLDYEILGDSDTESALADRLSSLADNAFFYKDAYNNGFHQDMILFSIRTMIPRFIMPEKPEGSIGIMATNYIRYGSLDPIGDSASSIGLFGSAYFWGGWPAALFMCIINAFVFSLLLSTCFSNLYNVFSWLFIFLIIFSMLLCFKETADGGYSQNIHFLIDVAIVYITSLIFYRKRAVYIKKQIH